MSEVTLFVRKASGLVRSWSTFDAFIYATFSINLITLGLFIFSYCYYFEGNLATAVVVGGIFTIFEVIVYAALISVMPRSGGDYVWQSRVLGGAVGFILALLAEMFSSRVNRDRLMSRPDIPVYAVIDLRPEPLLALPAALPGGSQSAVNRLRRLT